MLVGLNAQLLSLTETYRGAGISWYQYHLLRQLPASTSLHRFSVFLNERQYRDDRVKLNLSRWPTHNAWVRILWEQLILPGALRRQGVDLLHALAFAGPILFAGPTVVTVYDLSFLRFPEAFRPWNRMYLSHVTRLSVRRAKRVIAISRSTKQDIVDLMGVPPDKVEVVYCGADPAFHPLPAVHVDRFRQEVGLPENYVLFLGTLEPRKNLERLVRAYADWRKTDRAAPPLVIAGGPGWYYQTVRNLVRDLHLDDWVLFLGYVTRERLPALYNGAGLFVYPSLFEGFGLPVLEAMACGVPVVTSNVSSLPEVAGDAAVLVEPSDTEMLSAALRQTWNDPERRREMVSRGASQAARFRWDVTAERTLSVYESALGA